MHQQLTISIPEPCHENWDQMSAAEKGRYCSVCKKEVIDFTMLSDAAIISLVNNSKGGTCGNFFTDQLNRPMTVSKKQSPFRKYFYQLLIPAFLFSQKAKAQIGKISIKHTDTVKVVPAVNVTTGKNETKISSVVIDANTGMPLAFANIRIVGKDKIVMADSAGMFSISPVKEEMQMEVSSAGYQTKIIDFYNAGLPAAVPLTPDKKLLKEVVVTSSMLTRGTMRGEIGYSTARQDKKTNPITVLAKKIADSIYVKNKISVFPNPVAKGGQLNIELKNVSAGDYFLNLLTTDGSTVLSEQIRVPEKHFIFQLSLPASLPAGTYLLQTLCAGKLNNSLKIIIR